MGGGAWPFLVGGAICLVNSDNERDSSLLNRWLVFNNRKIFGFAVLLEPGFESLVRGGGGFVPYFGAWRGVRPFGPARGSTKRPTAFSRQSRLFLEGQAAFSRVTVSNNRSVMPLDVLGRTRATLKESACFSPPVREDRVTAEPPSWLGLWTAMIHMNQESLVGASH